MNALANGVAHALAHGGANACGQTSVYAKRREEKGPEGTTPHRNLFGSPASFFVASVTREAVIEG